MKWLNVLILSLAATLSVACTPDDDGSKSGGKPSLDPDIENLAGARADALANQYTKIADEMHLGELVEGHIDYPDWFHGHPIELRQGQTVSFMLNALDHGVVRLYGPAIAAYSDGRPYFDEAPVRGMTEETEEGIFTSEFTVRVNASGTYMLVYGPRYVWETLYDVKTECVAGCEVEATIEELEANPETFDGARVTVEGWVNLGFVACTRMACPVENPCCNRCGAGLNLHASEGERQGGIALTEEEVRYACEGNECNEREVCTIDEGRYVIEGIFTVGEFENTIEVIRRERLTEPCSTDADCSEGWCRAADPEMAGRECVPFVDEGESCGGFTMPHMVEACAPEQTCLYRPFVADAPGACRNVVTVSELQGNPERWDGVRVAVDGAVNTGAAVCTEMACSLAEPCCNSCGASQTLTDLGVSGEGIGLIRDGATLGCGGDNCNFNQNCDLEGDDIRVVGVFRAGQYGHSLEVEELSGI